MNRLETSFTSFQNLFDSFPPPVSERQELADRINNSIRNIILAARENSFWTVKALKNMDSSLLKPEREALSNNGQLSQSEEEKKSDPGNPQQQPAR